MSDWPTDFSCDNSVAGPLEPIRYPTKEAEEQSQSCSVFTVNFCLAHHAGDHRSAECKLCFVNPTWLWTEAGKIMIAKLLL